MKICLIDDFSENRVGGGHLNGIKAWIRLANYTARKYPDFEWEMRDKEEILKGNIGECDYYQSHRTAPIFGDYHKKIDKAVGLNNFISCLHGFTTGKFYRWSFDEIKQNNSTFHILESVAKILANSEEYKRYLKLMGLSIPVGSFATSPRPLFERGEKEGENIGAVGRITYEKGLDFLIELAKKGREIKFAGRPSITTPDKLEEEFNQTENITNKGKVPLKKMPEFYSTSSLIVHPSRMESSPLALKEAISCGTPVVCFNVGDSKKIVQGKNNKYECGKVIPYKPDITRHLSDAIKDVRFTIHDEKYHQELVNKLNEAITEVQNDKEYFSEQCREMMQNNDYIWNLEDNSSKLYNFYTE